MYLNLIINLNFKCLNLKTNYLNFFEMHSMLGSTPSNRVMGAGQRRWPGPHARVDAVEPLLIMGRETTRFF